MVGIAIGNHVPIDIFILPDLMLRIQYSVWFCLGEADGGGERSV